LFRSKASRRFPRRFRRGLIEAPKLYLDGSSPARHFRGDSAAASLKQVFRDAFGHQQIEFPRRFRRGLIEASPVMAGLRIDQRFPRRFRRGLIEARAPRASAVLPMYFRGDSAAASLKLSGRVSARRWHPYFRGDSAAASLKPLFGSAISLAEALFPRRFRRGLIEAGVRAHPRH